MDINTLPLETFIEILMRTDGITLGKCRRVCKYWRDCIDSTDLLWHQFCERDFKYSSRTAERKSGRDCQWYHIYKNLEMWANISTSERKVREFYKFTLHDKCHALDVDYSVLPLKDASGVVMYDMNTLKYIPVAIPERNCLKIANNDNVSILLLKSGLFLQRTVNNITHESEAFFKADNFVLRKDILYFYNNRDVFKCDLASEKLLAVLIIHCDYDIKEIQQNDRVMYIFTDCGKIVTIAEGDDITVKPINCPVEWIRQIRHICAFNDKNFVCYSRNLFKIETDKYQHLYLDFPPITALFFYGDVVLIGTRSGEILLYRLSSQKRAIKPIFENLAVLPDGKFAVQLDVCERKTGPVIIAATFFEIMFLEVIFFPHVSLFFESC